MSSRYSFGTHVPAPGWRGAAFICRMKTVDAARVNRGTTTRIDGRTPRRRGLCCCNFALLHCPTRPISLTSPRPGTYHPTLPEVHLFSGASQGGLMKVATIGRFLVMAGLLLMPHHVWARSAGSIAGVVRDTTGAVLPGVTVEAASPALIEKVRSVVSDGEGQYKILELRPGTYTVTFTLPGFNTFKREGVELTTGFTA